MKISKLTTSPQNEPEFLEVLSPKVFTMKNGNIDIQFGVDAKTGESVWLDMTPQDAMELSSWIVSALNRLAGKFAEDQQNGQTKNT
jgi:hypothetical protein